PIVNAEVVVGGVERVPELRSLGGVAAFEAPPDRIDVASEPEAMRTRLLAAVRDRGNATRSDVACQTGRADDRLGPTGTGNASVVHRAGVAVIARRIIRLEGADALTVHAAVANSATVVVVARPAQIDVQALPRAVTRIAGAGTAVVTAGLAARVEHAVR